MRDLVQEVAPTGYTVDYSGQSRQFMHESGGFLVTMLFAVIIVFLALAALFESFRDPVVILVSVPLALFGATIFIFLGFASINIYTEVGLVTLMGLISKHGILIVEVANQLRKGGMSKREAIEGAAAIRLRPILMTTFAMVFGVLPLVIASGAGAAGRHAMGLVIFTGMSIGTLFTLFVVPAMYMFLAGEHRVGGRQSGCTGFRAGQSAGFRAASIVISACGNFDAAQPPLAWFGIEEYAIEWCPACAAPIRGKGKQGGSKRGGPSIP